MFHPADSPHSLPYLHLEGLQSSDVSLPHGPCFWSVKHHTPHHRFDYSLQIFSQFSSKSIPFFYRKRLFPLLFSLFLHDTLHLLWLYMWFHIWYIMQHYKHLICLYSHLCIYKVWICIFIHIHVCYYTHSYIHIHVHTVIYHTYVFRNICIYCY